MIQYYFSPATKGIYCHEAHGNNIPNDAVLITNAIWQKQEQNPSWQIHYTNGKLDVVHPDTLLSEQERIERDRQCQLALARHQLDQSIKLESSVYQRRMSEEQQYEFIMYQDALLEFINGERQDMPEQPIFVQELL